MSNTKKSRSRRAKRKVLGKIDDFSKGVGLSPLRILFSLLLVGGLVFLIYWVGIRETTVKGGADKPLRQNNALKLALTTDQRLEEIMNTPMPKNENFLVVMNQMKKYEDELTGIEANQELTDSQVLKVERIRLRNQSVVVMLMVRNKIPCENEKKKLFDRCKALLDSPNEQLQEASHFWLCVIPTVEFVINPNDETLEAFKDSIARYKSGYIETPDHTDNLASLLSSLENRSGPALRYAKLGYAALAKETAESPISEVRFIGGKLFELSLFGEYELEKLDEKIAWSDPKAESHLEGAMQTLSEHTDANLSVWVSLIRGYESYLAVDKIEKVGAAWQNMWELSSKISDAETKELVREVLSRQKERAMSIGKPFDLTGSKLPDGDPIKIEGYDYVVVIFCDKSLESLRSLEKLGEANSERQVNYRPILVFEEELRKEDVTSLKIVPKIISVATHETGLKYMESFKADFFPYILLIDSSGNIVAANLQIDQVENRIAKLESAKRRKKTFAPQN